jgi:hypoxanthine phosphoribosyltransferase
MSTPNPNSIPPTQTTRVEEPSTRPIFSHQAEENFAKILDYYAIEWQYEPRTFPLEWDSNGKVIEAFSPDFYLPQQDLYIELTTLRPELTTRKNRKLRRMAELYPHVHVKLFKRRDLRDLMVKYGMDQEASLLSGSHAQATPSNSRSLE